MISSPRIVHLTSVHPRGDIRIFLKECRAVRDAGYNVHLVVADGRGDDNVQGITVHDVGRSRGRLDRMLSLSRRAVRRAVELSPALIHFHDPELLPACTGLARKGIQTVYDAHEDLPRSIMSKRWLHGSYRGLVSAAAERVEDFCASRMSAVVAATPIIAERFSRVNSEVESVCNYPDLSHAPNPPLRAPEPATFCYIGALSHHRGLFEMLRAAEMADARLVLAGPFDSSALEAEARAMPQWSRVDYLGVVPHAEVWNAMSRAIAGLLLLHPVRNYIDSLPIKMYEYMAAGLPIIASDYAGWPDVVREERVGLNCDPVSAEALASAMRMLIEAPSLAQEMGERGPEVVRARYRWENEAAKLLALYGRLLPASG